MKAKMQIGDDFTTKQDVLVGYRLSENVRWWGWSQWYKWRWNETHIDLGMISVYDLKRMWFWRIVAFLVKPLRWYYNRYRVTYRG